MPGPVARAVESMIPGRKDGRKERTLAGPNHQGPAVAGPHRLSRWPWPSRLRGRVHGASAGPCRTVGPAGREASQERPTEVRRDKDDLRELGIPIETVPYRIGALERPVHPYALVYGEGHWYLLAWCTVSEGVRIFRVDRILEVRVRYSPRIARWIAEREEGVWDADGSFVVNHRAVDPHWVVRHVLQYGPDAVVLEPEKVRRVVGNLGTSVPESAHGP